MSSFNIIFKVQKLIKHRNEAQTKSYTIIVFFPKLIKRIYNHEFISQRQQNTKAISSTKTIYKLEYGKSSPERSQENYPSWNL